MGIPVTDRQRRVLQFLRDESRAGRSPVMSAAISRAVGIGSDQVMHACSSLVDKKLVKGDRVRVGKFYRYFWEPVWGS